MQYYHPSHHQYDLDGRDGKDKACRMTISDWLDGQDDKNYQEDKDYHDDQKNLDSDDDQDDHDDHGDQND